MKLPRIGYLFLKYKFGSKLVLSALQVQHKMMKLPRIAYSLYKCKVGSNLVLSASQVQQAMMNYLELLTHC